MYYISLIKIIRAKKYQKCFKDYHTPIITEQKYLKIIDLSVKLGDKELGGKPNGMGADRCRSICTIFGIRR